MAGDNRASSSLFRRAEQIRRWQESETNRVVSDKVKKRKVKFSDGCIFLAAAAAGDKDELKRLLDRGADINTVNQDGITALHAACIDNNLEIVEFLVDNGADINRCDMEGWTPLHATASCGSLTMAKFLIDRNSDLSVVNNDGELAIDVVDDDDMAKLLHEEMDARGIDCDASRSKEERSMLEDAQFWLSQGQITEKPHAKTGATALHVASAKGYIKVMRLLIQAGSDINAKDFDGWTPLHAAVHWGQTEAVEILCDSMADMDIVNCVGQNPIDLADASMRPLLDELKRKQASIKLINQNSKKRKTSQQAERSRKKEKESNQSSSSSDGTSEDESTQSVEKRGTTVDQNEVQSWRRPSLRNKEKQEEKTSKEEPPPTPHINSQEPEVSISKEPPQSPPTTKDDKLTHTGHRRQVYLTLSPCCEESDNEECESPLRKTNSVPDVTVPISSHDTEKLEVFNDKPKGLSTSLRDISNISYPSHRRISPILSSKTFIPTTNHINKSAEMLARSQSLKERIQRKGSYFELEEAEAFKNNGLWERYCPDAPSLEENTSTVTATSPSRQNNSFTSNGRLKTNLKKSSSTTSLDSVGGSDRSATEVAAITAAARLSASSVIRNFFKSLVPPSRDDESETQRRAHAKMVRSIRRSTQGITLEDVRSAEQLMKTKQSTPNNVETKPETKNRRNSATKDNDDERRPSWRLKIDQSDKNRFSLEDVRAKEKAKGDDTEDSKKKNDSKKEEKSEDKVPTTREGTQAVIHRRKKAKRRSTGVVHVDMDEIDPDRKTTKDGEEDEEDSSVSEKEGTSRSSSRRGSSSKENGDIDYKKLYEEQLAENDRLMNRLRSYEKELRTTRETLAQNNKQNSARTITAESEKREKRALERKLSEMEDELKSMQKLKAENEKLRAENRALTRVVSKLTTSASSKNLSTLGK